MIVKLVKNLRKWNQQMRCKHLYLLRYIKPILNTKFIIRTNKCLFCGKIHKSIELKKT